MNDHSVSSYALNAQEICKLIKACKGSGVTKLKFGDLEITFGEATEIARPKVPLTQETPTVSEEQLLKAQIIEAEAVKQDELTEAKDSLENMLIEDPEHYEELIVRGELEDAGESSQDRLQH